MVITTGQISKPIFGNQFKVEIEMILGEISMQ